MHAWSIAENFSQTTGYVDSIYLFKLTWVNCIGSSVGCIIVIFILIRQKSSSNTKTNKNANIHIT